MSRNMSSWISIGLLSSACGCFLLGAGVTVLDVGLRSLAGRNVPAAIELTSFAIGLGALISIPVGFALRTHVTAKLLSELMPNRFGRPLGRAGAMASVIFAALILWIMAANTFSKLGSPETSRDLGLPMPVLLSVVSVASLMALGAACVGLWLEWRRTEART